MKSQQRLIFLILFLYFIRNNWAFISNLAKIRPSFEINSQTKIYPKCSIVKHDEDAVTSDKFTIPLNTITTSSKSYGYTDSNGHIIHLIIINEECISPMIFGLQYLIRLEIRNTPLVSCDDGRQILSQIECLASSLIDLGIYDTTITYLPNEMGKLINLKILTLSNIGLAYLPDSIGDLLSLRFLYLPNNNLTSLPVTIKNLRSLEVIILTNNRDLHSIEPLNGLPSLKILDTNNCPIAVLPRNLPKLAKLYMSNNNLTILSHIETLGNETNDQKIFHFNNNSIKFVSPQIRRVKNLFKLNLNDNQLDYCTLPLDIFEIPTLRHFSINNNSFTNDELKKIYMKMKMKMKMKNSFKLKPNCLI